MSIELQTRQRLENLETVVNKIKQMSMLVPSSTKTGCCSEPVDIFIEGGTFNEADCTLILTQAEGGADIVVDLSSLVSQYVDNGDGTFTFTSKNSTLTVDTNETVTTLASVNSGNVIGTYTSEDGTTTDIEETVTTLVDNGDGTFTYTNEAGTPQTFSIPDGLDVTVEDCIATFTNGQTIDFNGITDLSYDKTTCTLTATKCDGTTADVPVGQMKNMYKLSGAQNGVNVEFWKALSQGGNAFDYPPLQTGIVSDIFSDPLNSSIAGIPGHINGAPDIITVSPDLQWNDGQGPWNSGTGADGVDQFQYWFFLEVPPTGNASVDIGEFGGQRESAKIWSARCCGVPKVVFEYVSPTPPDNLVAGLLGSYPPGVHMFSVQTADDGWFQDVNWQWDLGDGNGLVPIPGDKLWLNKPEVTCVQVPCNYKLQAGESFCPPQLCQPEVPLYDLCGALVDFPKATYEPEGDYFLAFKKSFNQSEGIKIQVQFNVGNETTITMQQGAGGDVSAICNAIGNGEDLIFTISGGTTLDGTYMVPFDAILTSDLTDCPTTVQFTFNNAFAGVSYPQEYTTLIANLNTESDLDSNSCNLVQIPATQDLCTQMNALEMGVYEDTDKVVVLKQVPTTTDIEIRVGFVDNGGGNVAFGFGQTADDVQLLCDEVTAGNDISFTLNNTGPLDGSYTIPFAAITNIVDGCPVSLTLDVDTTAAGVSWPGAFGNSVTAIMSLVTGEAESICETVQIPNGKKRVNQANHGLSVLTPVYNDGPSSWQPATATDEQAPAYGIVCEVIDANTYLVLTTPGFIDVPGHNLTSNTIYFLGNTPGTTVTQEPETGGQFIQPIMHVIDENCIQYLGYEPRKCTDAAEFELCAENGTNVNPQTGCVELGGQLNQDTTLSGDGTSNSMNFEELSEFNASAGLVCIRSTDDSVNVKSVDRINLQSDGDIFLTVDGGEICLQTQEWAAGNTTPNMVFMLTDNGGCGEWKYQHCAAFRVDAAGGLLDGYGVSVIDNPSPGVYNVTLTESKGTNQNMYPILITLEQNPGDDDYIATYTNVTPTGFTVEVQAQDNGNAAGVPANSGFSIIVPRT